jgi:hypothetical protein
MKTVPLSIIAAFHFILSIHITAQIPNGNFELWNQVVHEQIETWQSFGKVNTHTASNSGQYAVKLEHDSTNGNTAFVMHGNHIQGLGFVGGIPYAQRPDSVKGFFKCYSPFMNDAAVLMVIFKKNGIQLSNQFFFIPVSNDTTLYEEHAFEITYSHPTETPDSVIILLTNPRPFQDTVYTGWLIADDLHFTNTSTPIVNGDFEQWSVVQYDQAQSWFSQNVNAVNLGQFPVTKTNDCQEGNHAVKIENIIQGSTIIPGFVKTSTMNSPHFGSFPLNERHTSLSGYYKGFPQNNDSLSIVMLIYAQDTIAGYAFLFETDTVSQYKKFDTPIFYSENFNGIPDSAFIYLASYNIFGGSPQGNSQLFVDNLQLHTNYNIVANEIQSSNSSVFFDNFGNAEDWIELYNSGNSPVSLGGFFISDNLNNPTKWKIPNIVIDSAGFVVLVASGKDLHYPFLHTNFKISSQGEDILITSPTGTLIDHILPQTIPNDISYGRYPDGSQTMVFFTKPTPKSANSSQTALGFTSQKPMFSLQGGFYQNPVSLTLSTSHPNAVIRYTLDGSVPTINSPIYTSSINIESRTGDPNIFSMITGTTPWWSAPVGEVFKSTPVRAKLFIPDTIAVNTETHTFFVDNGIFSRYNVPIISVATDSTNLFGYIEGIYMKGKVYDDYDSINPGGNPIWIPGNYSMSGDAWERPAHIEFFNTDGTLGFASDAGIRIHGGITRNLKHKSLRLYFREKYGTDQISFSVFPNGKIKSNGQPLNQFKRIVLRNSGNDYQSTFFRDGMAQSLISHASPDIQNIRAAAVFINGEFWGFHNMRERQDKYYINTHYFVNEDDVHILQTNAHVSTGPPDANQHYIDMLTFAHNNNLNQPSNYAHVQTMMDINNYIDYQCFNIYIGNADWPGNNIKYWRKNTNQYMPNSLYGHDGRWRWLVYDTDFGFGLANGMSAPLHNTLAFALDSTQTHWPNPQWSTFLFRSLIKNTHFQNDFINRMADHMNTSFIPHRVIETIDSMQFVYYQNMPEHINRWHPPASMQEWDAQVNIMRHFALHRPNYMKQHVVNYFNLPGTAQVTLNVSDESHGHVKINTIHINPNTVGIPSPTYPWVGTYFQSIPIPLQAIAKPGYQFVEWAGTGNTNPHIQVTLNANTSLTALFEIDTNYVHPTLFINELMASNATTIADEFGEYDDWIEIYNASSDTIDMAGMFITDDLSMLTKHQIPQGSQLTKIPPLSFLLLWADNQISQGVLHLPFKLSAAGEAVAIVNSDGTSIIDSITFGTQITDISYGRYPDGNDLWVAFTYPTPGASNTLTSIDENEDSISQFHVFPNPVNNILYLSQTRDIQIFDLQGRLIHSEQQSNRVDVTFFAKGFYILRTSLNEIINFTVY